MAQLGGLLGIADLRKRIFYTLAMIIVFRLGAHIPVAGVDPAKLAELFGRGNLLSLVDLFTGGALVNFSIFAMGIIPYINASIIMQLLTVILPNLEQMAKESESGRRQIAQYTRYLTVGLAVFQAVGMSFWLRGVLQPGVLFAPFLVSAVISLVAGSVMVLWLSELITENGIGNGASLLIFVGIVARVPSYIGSTVTLVRGGVSLASVIILAAVLLAVVVGIVVVQEAQRRVPIQYAKRVVGRKVYGGQSTYLPLRINQGGVIPIIFASSVLLFPATIAQFVPNAFVQSIASWFAPSGSLYMIFYFVLIFFFTYFYTAITFNPTDISENIKKYGGFIMGIRPGKPTAEFLEHTITRLTLVGALFLALVAIVPLLAEGLTRVTSFQGLGGTALLIVVGVALDLVRQIQTHLITRQYEGLLG